MAGVNSSNIIGNHFANNGTAMVLDNADSNTISGNQIETSVLAGIEVKDGSDHNLIDSNLIRGVAAISSSGGGLFLHGANYNTLSHNQIEDTAGIGIGIENWDAATVNIGNTVSYNIVRNTGTSTPYDSGGIYVLGRSHLDTQTTINNNLVEVTGPGGNAHDVAVYLDDFASGITVSNNVLRSVGTHAIQVHGGQNVLIKNNIMDLGSGSNSAIFFQDINQGDIKNVEVTQNVVISARGSQRAYDLWLSGSPNIHGNEYWTSVGSAIDTWPETNPVVADPKFQNPAAGNYALGPGSGASLVGFVAIDQSAIGLHPATEHWYA